MKTISLSIFFGFLLTTLIGQPGYGYRLAGNLNDIDSTMLKKCMEEGSFCEMGEIWIDSTTDLSRINHLIHMERLVLVIKLENVPKQFEKIEFKKLQELVIYGQNVLRNISSLRRLHQLRRLYLFGFGGERIEMGPDNLEYLESIDISDGQNLIYIDGLLKLPAIIGVQIAYCPQLVHFAQPPHNYNHIKQLVIRDCDKVDVNDICNFTFLKYLYIYGLSVTNRPDCFSNLEKLQILH